MVAPAKPVKYSMLRVILSCMYYFGLTHHSKMIYLLLIVLITLGSSFLYGVERWLDALKTCKYSALTCYLFFILVANISYSGLYFVKYFLFETYLCEYGTIVSSIAMRNLLYSENPEFLELPGGQVEYYVTEGSKEMAKIARQIFLELFSKSLDLFIDLFILRQNDMTANKVIFITALVATIIMMSIKFYHIRRTSYHMKVAADLSYEREKLYTELFDNMTLVKAYRSEQPVQSKYKKRLIRWQDAIIHYRLVKYFGKIIFDSSGIIFRVCAAMWFIRTNKDVTARSVTNILTISGNIIESGVSLIKIFQILEESFVLTGTVMNYLNLANDELKNKKEVDMFNDKIEIKELTYSSRGRVIFSDVNFTLRLGDKAALYGRNGIGKSSIFKVLMNFDEFTGSIKLDGTDIRRFIMTDYRSLITFVPQDTKLFDDTIYENLVFGNDKSYEEIIEESKRMGIHNKIMLMPHGYNTVVGEGGRNLNGGLRQKIFYTRAFLRDTPIYLFDEPTNNLDQQNANFLVEYIRDEKYKKKTFLVICHDMGIVEAFPKIYKFTEGKIVLEKE